MRLFCTNDVDCEYVCMCDLERQLMPCNFTTVWISRFLKSNNVYSKNYSFQIWSWISCVGYEPCFFVWLWLGSPLFEFLNILATIHFKLSVLQVLAGKWRRLHRNMTFGWTIYIIILYVSFIYMHLKILLAAYTNHPCFKALEKEECVCVL